MSALPPIADIRPRDQDVCFGQEADIEPPLWRRLVPEASGPPASFLDCSFGGRLNWKHYLKSCTAPGIRLCDDTTAVEFNNHSRYRKPQSRPLLFSCNKSIKYFRRALLFEARPRILHRDNDLTLILPFSLKL